MIKPTQKIIAYLLVAAYLIMLMRVVIPVVNFGIHYTDYVSICRTKYHHPDSCAGKCQLTVQLSKITTDKNSNSHQIAAVPYLSFDLISDGWKFSLKELSKKSACYFPKEQKLLIRSIPPVDPPPVS